MRALEVADLQRDRLGLVAAGPPLQPPRDWFERPEPDDPSEGTWTVTADGQVYGYAALWDSCHTGKPGRCVRPPRSASKYGYYMTGLTEVEDGELIPTGRITLGTGHASLTASPAATAEHYDNTGAVAADVRIVDGKHGIWVSGALRPDVSPERARELRGASLSGDWRNIRGSLEMLGLLAVNVPGFPVPRAMVASGEAYEGHEEILALVAAGVIDGPILTPEQLAEIEPDEADWDAALTDLANAIAHGDDVLADLDPVGAALEALPAAALPPEGKMTPEVVKLEVGDSVSFERDGEQFYIVATEDGLEEMTAAAYDESKHKRHPKGNEKGGQFAPKESVVRARQDIKRASEDAQEARERGDTAGEAMAMNRMKSAMERLEGEPVMGPGNEVAQMRRDLESGDRSAMDILDELSPAQDPSEASPRAALLKMKRSDLEEMGRKLKITTDLGQFGRIPKDRLVDEIMKKRGLRADGAQEEETVVPWSEASPEMLAQAAEVLGVTEQDLLDEQPCEPLTADADESEDEEKKGTCEDCGHDYSSAEHKEQCRDLVASARADKVAKVMREFKAGKLKSSSGEVVKDRKQALAIALSESRHLAAAAITPRLREALIASGDATPDGRVVLRSRADLGRAITAATEPADQAWVVCRAVEMDLVPDLPATWDVDALLAAGFFDETKHARHPKGVREGGRFAPKGRLVEGPGGKMMSRTEAAELLDKERAGTPEQKADRDEKRRRETVTPEGERQHERIAHGEPATEQERLAALSVEREALDTAIQKGDRDGVRRAGERLAELMKAPTSPELATQEFVRERADIEGKVAEGKLTPFAGQLAIDSEKAAAAARAANAQVRTSTSEQVATLHRVGPGSAAGKKIKADLARKGIEGETLRELLDLEKQRDQLREQEPIGAPRRVRPGTDR